MSGAARQERPGLAALDRAAGAVADAERRGQGERAADRAGLRAARAGSARGAGGVGGRGGEGGVAGGEGLVLEAEEEAGPAGHLARHGDRRLALERRGRRRGRPRGSRPRLERRRRGGIDRAFGQGEREVDPLGGEVLDEEARGRERRGLRVGVDGEAPAAGRGAGVDRQGQRPAAGALVGERDSGRTRRRRRG